MNNDKNTNKNQEKANLFKKLREMETKWQNHGVQLLSLLFPSSKNNETIYKLRLINFRFG